MNWNFGNLSAQAGKKIKGYLQFPTINEKLPITLINGESDGPTILIMAGIHGCEYTSIDAALKLGRQLEPNHVKGKIVVLPIANPASFYARSIYVHPEDNKNLNRMFPGKEDGTAAERLAYWITETVIKEVDVVIDLHGGDMIEALVPFTIYQVTEDERLTEESKDIASLFGIQYVVGSKGQVSGSTYSIAAEEGKIAIIAEAGQQGILDSSHSHLLQEGTKNSLRKLGVLEGDVEREPVEILSVFDWYFAEQSGLWYPGVEIGETVEMGAYLGKMTDEFGDTIKEFRSTTEGVVLFLVTSLAMNVNNPLLAVGK